MEAFRKIMLYDNNLLYAGKMGQVGKCKNHLSILLSKKFHSESACQTHGGHPVQAGLFPEHRASILLQPPLQSVHPVPRFNPTVPHPQANRILSQSIMLIAKELACPWGSCGKILQGFRPHPPVTANCRGAGSKGGLASRLKECCCEEEGEGSSNRCGFISREQHRHSLPLISAHDPITNFFL